jgi:iron complex transport system permease protein
MPSSTPSSPPAEPGSADAEPDTASATAAATTPTTPRGGADASGAGAAELPRNGRWYAAGIASVVVAVLAGVMIGPAGPTWWRVPLELLDRLPLISIDSGVSDIEWNILWSVRMPRVLLGGLVGAMLALAGASYQGVFRNPLVEPYLLGAAAGAGLGATLVFTVMRSATEDWPVDPAPAAAFVVAILTVTVTYLVGGSFGGARSGVTLVLAGVAVSALASALQTFILQRNVDVVREVFTWILGRLSTARWDDVRLVVPYVAVSSLVLFAHRRHLDVFRVGEDEASTLGAPVARVRLVVVIAATLGTAAVVSVSGLIGFVGIAVPHLVRLVAGASYRRVLPLSFLFGATFLIVADIPGRVLTKPAETPIGVVTAFLGAPFLILVLRTSARRS